MARPKVERVAVDAIDVRSRLRVTSEAAVKTMMESLADLGLKTPITVRWVNDNECILVAGATRLEAAKRLGWKHIDTTPFEGSEISARLWEIAENLHRAELTVTDRAEHIAEWVRLTEEEKVGQVAPPGGKQPKEQGVRAASRDLGIERTEVRRAVKIDGLAPEAKAEARASGLADNQSALLAAAKHETAPEQVAELRRKADERASRKAREHAEVKDAKGDAREVLAQAIADYVPEVKLGDVGAALALLGLKEVASRIQAITGAVFDKTNMGTAA